MRSGSRTPARHFYSVALLAALSVPLQAPASVVLEDGFDDGILDCAWTVSFVDANGWSYDESGSALSATDIDPSAVNHTSGDAWSKILLSRTFAPLEDFGVDFSFSWDSLSNVQAMQRLVVSLHDASGSAIAIAGYDDSWVDLAGGMLAIIDGTSFFSGPDTLDLSGSAVVEIRRADDAVSILWDGNPVASAAQPAQSIESTWSFGTTPTMVPKGRLFSEPNPLT